MFSQFTPFDDVATLAGHQNILICGANTEDGSSTRRPIVNRLIAAGRYDRVVFLSSNPSNADQDARRYALGDNAIQSLIEEQNAIVDEALKSGANVSLPRLALILEDIDQSTLRKDRAYHRLIYNGRFLNISVLQTNESCMCVEPPVRANIDWLFVAGGAYSVKDWVLLRNRFGCDQEFHTQQCFDEVLQKCTTNGVGDAMVLKIRSPRAIFYYPCDHAQV